MNILVNGPSVSRGPGSWPYLLQEHYNADLVNLSQSGAGNTYIHETTVAELAQRSYDLVAIMWADQQRLDIKVKNIDHFQDTIYTSKFQKTMNDWPEKIVEPVNDQDYVQDNWVFGCGYINTKDPCLVELFDSYYQHTDNDSRYFSSIIKMISLQGVLKNLGIKYVFCGVRTLPLLDRYKHLYQLLDWNCIINDFTPHHVAYRDNCWEADQIHPGPAAHQEFADHMIAQLQQRHIVT